jgi:CheY-like chemotaxis protein
MSFPNDVEISNTLLKVFILEDMKTDQELVKMQIRKIAPDALFTIAANRNEFLEKIKWTVPDLILADQRLPDFSGTEALAYVKERMPHIPFVFVTGTLNDEEEASEIILKGASAYILKKNLESIPERIPAILEVARLRFQAEEEKRAVFRKQKLLLQKLEVVVSQANSFPEQEEALKIIENIFLNLRRFINLNIDKD